MVGRRDSVTRAQLRRRTPRVLKVDVVAAIAPAVGYTATITFKDRMDTNLTTMTMVFGSPASAPAAADGNVSVFSGPVTWDTEFVCHTRVSTIVLGTHPEDGGFATITAGNLRNKRRFIVEHGRRCHRTTGSIISN